LDPFLPSLFQVKNSKNLSAGLCSWWVSISFQRKFFSNRCRH